MLGSAADRRDAGKADADRLISQRMSLMAHAAWKRELMSEGQLAELLKITRLQLREIVDEIELEEKETDDLLKFPE